MEELGRLEDDRRAGKAPGPVREQGTAGNEMCTFLIVNISSLQLIPVSVIAYRSQYGSVNPAGIIGPAILATAGEHGSSGSVLQDYGKAESVKPSAFLTAKGHSENNHGNIGNTSWNNEKINIK